jgi:serine/threonine-protein kinase
MGVVYRAYDQRLKRNVALKLVAPELSNEARFRERFLEETEVAASLEHPNVVPVHDAGEVDGQLYLAMRHVEGSDLKTLLAEQGALEPARAIAICSQVAGALDQAHEHGLVHRDVKPSNVLLDQREHVYLADFGLSRRLSEPGWPPAPASRLARLPTRRPSRSRAAMSTAGPTSTRSAASCTSA